VWPIGKTDPDRLLTWHDRDVVAVSRFPLLR
jgi:hypothetical protein